jgi:hypothetical protein
VGQQLLCNADEHLSDVLLLADGQLAPQLMGRNPVVGLAWGAARAGWTRIAADSLLGVLDVLKHTQQLFNSRKRQGRGTHIVGIKLQVGGAHWNQPFDMGPQPDHTTPTELSMVSDGDKREGLAT